MRIVFLGSAEFALPSLRELVNKGYKVLCVVTRQDKKQKRGLLLGHTPVKNLALELGLNIFQPEDINAQESEDYLRSLQADLFIVVSFGQILSERIINLPKIFSINLHPSLLPKYRGPAPINWALFNGEKKTGVSVLKVVKKVDAGPLILQREEEIFPEDDALTLSRRLSEIGSQVLIEALNLIQQNKFSLIPQNEKEVTFAPLLKKQDGLINWNKTAYEIYNFIRGCAGWPGAFTYYKNKLLKIHKSYVFSQIGDYSERGKIVHINKETIVVSTQRGLLGITELQMEGKRRMLAREFICGHKIKVGEFLGGI